jgi:2-keto-4-pentenoate hydratase
MMKPADVQHAAGLLWESWQDGRAIDALPAPCRPVTRADGYAIQAEFDRLSGTTRVGWKIAATSTAGQRHIGVEGPLLGRIFAARCHSPGTVIPIVGNRMRVAEPEFAFRFGRTLQPRATPYAVAEVMAAVDSLHLALELPDSRFVDFVQAGGPSLIADNACAHELMLGPAVTAEWRTLDLSQHPVRGSVRARYERSGSGANVLGDPRVALTWSINELATLGIAITAGEFVTTGTAVVPLEILSGDRITGDFGSLGTIELAIGTG